jgi:hypothetical protein
MSQIEVGKDFSRTPGGRYISDGPDSGQLFRDRYIVPELKRAIGEQSKLVIILDGPRGYLSSFLEEAFGGLVRYGMFSHRQLKDHLEVRANDPFYQPYKILALRYIAESKQENVAAAS